MSTYLAVKWLHVLSAILLFGTGLGSAFYMYLANRSPSLEARAVTARHLVLADWLFTTPAILVQPVTGLYLARAAGWPLDTPWIAASLALYCLAGACWLPVVWLQMRMRNLAEAALRDGTPLPPSYGRCARTWERLGYPAFAAMLAILWLMVVKPDW